MNRHGERLTYPDYGRAEILRDFEGHQLTIERDDGVHRHLRFRARGTSTYWFDIVTWPGVLVINGDCGTYVFSRIEDMLEFFRQPNGRDRINPGYWAEKLRATDCHGTSGHLEYSEHKGRGALASAMRSLRERGACNEVVRDLRTTAVLDDGADCLVRSVSSWSFRESVGKAPTTLRDRMLDSRPTRTWEVADFWDHRFTDYTQRFLWNLHAIVWGIAQYDTAKQPATAGATA